MISIGIAVIANVPIRCYIQACTYNKHWFIIMFLLEYSTTCFTLKNASPRNLDSYDFTGVTLHKDKSKLLYYNRKKYDFYFKVKREIKQVF